MKCRKPVELLNFILGQNGFIEKVKRIGIIDF